MIDKKKITKKPEQNIINSEWSSNDPEPWHKQKKKKKYYFGRNMTANCYTVSSPLSKNVNGLKTEDRWFTFTINDMNALNT